MTLVETIAVKRLGRAEYLPTLAAMQRFTRQRAADTPDELWLLEHPPVYTLGQGAERPAPANGIPLVRSDRGGDVTYHGPGQLVAYTLIDLARRGIKVRQFVGLLEQSVIDLIGPRAQRWTGAPGVYVGGAKVAALGLRVRQGRAYHGLALNVEMDLTPFYAIDPCGYPGLAVTQLSELGIPGTVESVGDALGALLAQRLEHA